MEDRGVKYTEEVALPNGTPTNAQKKLLEGGHHSSY